MKKPKRGKDRTMRPKKAVKTSKLVKTGSKLHLLNMKISDAEHRALRHKANVTTNGNVSMLLKLAVELSSQKALRKLYSQKAG